MPLQENKQNIYIRKLNGLGQKISVHNSLTIKQLKNIVQSLKNLEVNQVKQIDFDLFFKGKNIADKEQFTLLQLNIPSEGIIHIVFKQQKLNNKVEPIKTIEKTNSQIQQCKSIDLRIMFNNQEHKFQVLSDLLVLEFKKIIAKKLNLIFQSLVLSHFGSQMMNDKSLRFYNLKNYTLLSLKFNLQKLDKKKLQTRMVSSVTFSDQNNQPNSNQLFIQQFQNKQLVSSKSIDSQKDEDESSRNHSNNLASKNMYKSDINGLCKNAGTSKAALMFKNALHQKIIQTQSIVSGSFSQDTLILGNDPNSLMITIKNEQDTKQFVFQCNKTHQMINIREKLLQIQNIDSKDKLEISMEEDLFQSIDLNKSGSLNLHQIIKKMGKQRAVFIYRLIK